MYERQGSRTKLATKVIFIYRKNRGVFKIAEMVGRGEICCHFPYAHDKRWSNIEANLSSCEHDDKTK